MKLHLSSSFAVVLTQLAGAALLHAASVTAPYTNDFSTDPASVITASHSYNGTGTGSIGWNSTSLTYNSTLSNADYGQVNTNWATVSASNLNASNSSFSLSTDFTVTSSTNAGGSSSVGLGVSSSNNFPTYSGANFYVGQFTFLDTVGTSSGRLSIIQSNGGAGTSIAVPAVFSGFSLNTTYRLTLTGVYDGSGNLLLNFSITNGTTTQSVNATVVNAFTGLNNYGYQHQISNWANTTVQFDNLSVGAVPEPSTVGMALLGLGGLFFVINRRRVRLAA